MSQPNEQSSYAAGLAGLFDESEKSHQKFTKKTREEMLAPHFVPRKATEQFRIFATKTGEFFSIAYFHYIKVGNRYQKLYCPKHNDGTSCALCNLVDKLTALEDQNVKKKVFEKASLTEEEKKIAEKNTKIYNEKKKWAASKYYILRGIDQQVLKDGIKFWRFKFNKKKEGVLDKLQPVLKQYQKYVGHDPVDIKNGADLLLTVADLAMPNQPTRTYKSVTAINYLGPKPAVENNVVYEALIADQRTWKDIFQKKNPPHISYEEYLTLITQNKAPYYDESDPKNKRWVYPGNPDLELKANTRTSNNQAPQGDDNFDPEDDAESSMMSYTQEQINQHKPIDVTVSSSQLTDAILSSNTTPTAPQVQNNTSPTSTDDADPLNGLPF